MEVINSNSYRSNVFQNQPTFQGYVDIKLKNQVNKMLKEEIDKFIKPGVTKSEVENEILNPVKAAYNKLVEIMKQFPDNLSASCESESYRPRPCFSLKDGDNEMEFFVYENYYTDGDETNLYDTGSFKRFVAEIDEKETFKPSKIIEKIEKYYKEQKAMKEYELLREEMVNSKTDYLS